MKNHRLEVVAAIDVGSNTLRMVIAQVTPNGEYFVLEELDNITNIGMDTFRTGRVGVKSIRETCEVLKNYVRLMEEYKVKTYIAVSTSGIREAENRDYVLEQVKLFTGLTVRVINNAEERFFMYKALQDNLVTAKQMYKEGTMILNVGSGGVEVTVYNEGSLQFTEYIKVGAQRLHEILSEIASKTLNFPSVMEEFVDSKIDFLKPGIEKMNIKNFIGLGGDLMIISTLCSKDKNKEDRKFIKKEALNKLYSKVSIMTDEKIAMEYSISKAKAALILPSLILFNSFLDMTKADGIYAPLISLKHGLLADIIDELYNTKRRTVFLNDIINSVRHIAKKI